MKPQPNESKRHDSRPNIREFIDLFEGPIDIRSIALTGILVLLTLYTLYFAREFLLPIVLAYVLSLLLTPVVRGLKRIHMPEVLGAGLVLLVALGIVAYGSYRLAGPATKWIQEAPYTLSKVKSKLGALVMPVKKAQQTTEQIEKTLDGTGENRKVEVKKPGLGAFIFSGTQAFLLTGGVTIVLLYFLLASGDLFLLKLVKVLPTLEDKKRAVEIFRQIEGNVSTYLWTITLINGGLGIAIGTAMYFLGMPNPALWGVMGMLFNYVPYLGATAGIIIVAIAATLTFDDALAILLPPLAYFVCQVVEANFITPLALGRRLALNPVIIFVWLIFWGWMWGVAGALLAVPLLAILKIICDHFDALSPFGEFLGKEPQAASPL